MNAKYNPFYYGGIIKESRLFVGRKREVAEIVEAIATSASVSLTGEKRIGKSSLLRYLSDPSVEQKNGLDISRYVFSYFDFLGYQKVWLDTNERIRKGFAWIDVKAIIRRLVVAKGADSVLDWIARLLKLIRQ
jgi:AAA+ ATPase superfamily predicted ATPase